MVRFISDAPVEDFEGVTGHIDGYLPHEGNDLYRGSEVYFEVDLRTLDTGIDLRDEHMRENYLETDEYPRTWFKGSISNTWTDERGLNAKAKGSIFIHGVIRICVSPRWFSHAACSSPPQERARRRGAGSAWNTEVTGRDAGNNRNFQYFVQLILNTAWSKRVAFGLVPSYLYNAHIECDDVQYSLTLGLHATVFITDVFHFTMEWNPTLAGWRTAYDVAAFGIELETGGHFFKVIASNSDKVNTSQILPGSTESFGAGEWHIGFNITRILAF